MKSRKLWIVSVFILMLGGAYRFYPEIHNHLNQSESEAVSEVLVELSLDGPRTYLPIEDEVLGIENPLSNYCYLQLSDVEQIVYKEIGKGVLRHEIRIPVTTVTGEELNRAFAALTTDHPEFFWVDINYTVLGFLKWDKINFIEPQYNTDRLEREWNQIQMEEEILRCLEGVSEEASEYEKVRYIYEYIIEHVDYSEESLQNQNIQSVFLNRESVCAGYSKSAQVLLNRMGIFCTYITGITKTPDGTQISERFSNNHAWNLLKIDEEYYYMDTTWGDPIFTNEADVWNRVSYDYLNLTSEEIKRNHEIYGYFTQPECVADEYNYYVQEDLLFSSYDPSHLNQRLKGFIDQENYQIAFKFRDKGAYMAAVDGLFENDEIDDLLQYYMKKSKTQSCTYYYVNDDKLFTIKLSIDS